MKTIKLISVNVKHVASEYKCKGENMLEIIEELETQIPGIKDELLVGEELSSDYMFMVKGQNDLAHILKTSAEEIKGCPEITVLPVISGG